MQDQSLIKNNKAVKLDIRFITSSTKDMQEEIAQGKFRQDLYFRLNVVPLYVTNLSERKEDIPLLFYNYCFSNLVVSYGRKNVELDFDLDAVELLMMDNISWPGNVRQLQKVAKDAANILKKTTTM